MLDEGTLTDSQGRKVDFKNSEFDDVHMSAFYLIDELCAAATIILTSNMGSDILAEDGSTLPDGTVTDSAKERVLGRVQSMYPPELVSRRCCRVRCSSHR